MKEKVSEERTHREDYGAPAPAPAVASTTSHSSSTTTTTAISPPTPNHFDYYSSRYVPSTPPNTSSAHQDIHHINGGRQPLECAPADTRRALTLSLTDSLTLTSPATSSSPSSTSFTLYLSSSSFFLLQLLWLFSSAASLPPAFFLLIFSVQLFYFLL